MTNHVSLEQLGTQMGYDNSSMPVDLRRALREFQGLRTSVITGGASGASVSLPAYVTGDQVVSIISQAAGGITLTAHTDFVYAATFALKQNSNNASGLQCIVTWFDMSGFNYGE